MWPKQTRSVKSITQNKVPGGHYYSVVAWLKTVYKYLSHWDKQFCINDLFMAADETQMH